MSLQDPVSDMLTSIRNAQAVAKPQVTFPSSKLKVSILNVLKYEGYIEDFKVEQDGPFSTATVDLKYYNGKPVISLIKRISKPGLRVYKTVKEIPQVLGGLGIAVVSTSKGVMTGHRASKQGLGGEILCIVE